MDQMMGNLLWAKIQPSEIESMSIRRMSYWNKWAELMAKEWTKTAGE